MSELKCIGSKCKEYFLSFCIITNEHRFKGDDCYIQNIIEKRMNDYMKAVKLEIEIMVINDELNKNYNEEGKIKK